MDGQISHYISSSPSAMYIEDKSCFRCHKYELDPKVCRFEAIGSRDYCCRCKEMDITCNNCGDTGCTDCCEFCDGRGCGECIDEEDYDWRMERKFQYNQSRWGH